LFRDIFVTFAFKLIAEIDNRKVRKEGAESAKCLPNFELKNYDLFENL
jgi:hypothetical protein